MKKVLIFPAPFLIKNPTADQQNEYMISLLRDEMAMEGIGDFIGRIGYGLYRSSWDKKDAGQSYCHFR